ncbi:MAG: replication initiation protein RepC [Cohaesibacter sp.]|nr:replication initiation protein RepC [Cohaesibacter sp.]
MTEDKDLKSHHRKTKIEHLAFEEMAEQEFEPLSKTSLYRLIDGLRQVRFISPSDADVLRAILGAAGADYLCYCANKTLAARVGIVNESQISHSVRRLRDKGLITTRDSANCKRDKGFGLNIAILHVRYQELLNSVSLQKQEMKDRLDQKRCYRSSLRKIQSFIAHEELTDELMSFLYELRQQTLNLVAEQKDKTAALYKEAIGMIEAGLRSVYNRIKDTICIGKESCLRDNLPTHLLNTNLNLIVFSNQLWRSAKADHSKTPDDAYGIELALKKKPEADFAEHKILVTHSESGETDIELRTLLHACPALKRWCRSALTDWSDLIAEIDHLCVMAGISNDAKQSALQELGPRRFLMALAITLQKADSGAVRSPGGYIRGIVSKFRDGNLHLNRSLFGLMSARTKAMYPD